jgi:protein SCO1
MVAIATFTRTAPCSCIIRAALPLQGHEFMPKSRAPLFAGIAIVAILAGALSAQFIKSSHQPDLHLSNGTVLPPRATPAFQLIDTNANGYDQAQLIGHWSLLFFGYTSCPDVCPTTLSLLAQVQPKLADLHDAQRLQMVFVSVDPKRDTPAQVGQYVKFFSPEFVGLTGTPKNIEQFTRAMGVPVAIHDTGSGAYTVDHAATLFLLDAQAHVVAVFSPPHTVDALASDLRTVITQLR